MANKNISINLLWITIFSIAMGYLESAVVVYLRAIYYEGGFEFPLVPISGHHVITEIGREAATLFLLIGIGIIAGRNKWERFAVFLYTFAVWDIFYYVFLKLLLNWPESLLTWDILFLIPTTWVGPVIAPVISALTMVLLAVVIIYFNPTNNKFPAKWEITILITGSVIQIIAFVWDYLRYLKLNGVLTKFLNYEATKDIAFSYIPQSFPWLIFLTGEFVILWGIYKVYRKSG